MTKKLYAILAIMALVACMVSAVQFVQAVPPDYVSIRSDGFETGTTENWDHVSTNGLYSKAPLIVAGAAHSGNFGMRTQSAAPWAQVCYVQNDVGPMNNWTVSAFFRFNATDSYYHSIMYVFDAPNVGFATNAGKIYATYSSGYYNGTTYNTGQWYNLTIDFYLDRVQWYVDNEMIYQLYDYAMADYYTFVYWLGDNQGNVNPSFSIDIDDADFSIDYTPPPTPTPEPTPTLTPTLHRLPYFDMNYYFHDLTVSTNDYYGYLASPDQPTSNTSIDSMGGDVGLDTIYGVRIYLLGNRTTYELTDGTPAAQATLTFDFDNNVTVDLEATWTAPQTYLEFGKDALEFDVCVSYDGGTNWATEAVFITEHIMSKQMFESEVTLHYYAEKWDTATETNSRFNWGGGADNYISGATGFIFKEATPPDYQQYYLGQQNLVMFIVAPYTVILGNTFFGVVLLAIAMSVYIRYNSLGPVVLLFVLLAGSIVAGGINIAFGEYVVGLIWAACAFGLGLVYWRVFR